MPKTEKVPQIDIFVPFLPRGVLKNAYRKVRWSYTHALLQNCENVLVQKKKQETVVKPVDGSYALFERAGDRQ